MKIEFKKERDKHEKFKAAKALRSGAYTELREHRKNRANAAGKARMIQFP